MLFKLVFYLVDTRVQFVLDINTQQSALKKVTMLCVKYKAKMKWQSNRTHIDYEFLRRIEIASSSDKNMMQFIIFTKNIRQMNSNCS